MYDDVGPLISFIIIIIIIIIKLSVPRVVQLSCYTQRIPVFTSAWHLRPIRYMHQLYVWDSDADVDAHYFTPLFATLYYRSSAVVLMEIINSLLWFSVL